jgi:hypothetical protein
LRDFVNNTAAVVLLICGLAAPTRASAQQDDVTFFVIGKHGNYRQLADGARNPVDYSFFAEIFLTKGGDASAATLTFPGGESIEFADMRLATDGSHDNILLVSGGDRFGNYADLQERFPDGRYVINFTTPSGSVDDGGLHFAAHELPDPPRIRLHQAGSETGQTVAAGEDLNVTWSPFSRGSIDQNGILDDLVFVILTDADGRRVAHSGRPFENRPYLDFASSEFTIDGGVLRAGEHYTLSVEHAILDDTRTFGGVPAMTTRAVTTKLEIAAEPR